METPDSRVTVDYVAHGMGRPVLVLHGAGVDHRETEACFEPMLDRAGLQRIYPDLPGMGGTPAPPTLRSADDVLDTLLDFADDVTDGRPYLLIGHSAGGYYAQAMAARHPARVAGLALVCPLLPGVHDVPQHRRVDGVGEIGDEVFRSYFVIQTPQMLDRYRRYVEPGAALVDQPALDRIGQHWEITPAQGPPYPGPTLIVAGRLDSTVGHTASTQLLATTRTPRSPSSTTPATPSPTNSHACSARSSPTGSRGPSTNHDRSRPTGLSPRRMVVGPAPTW